METTKKSPKNLVRATVLGVMLALGLAPMAAWAAPGVDLAAGGADLHAQAAADPINVYMTVSDQGTLALARQEITVKDIDKDGKITFDEALQVTHKKYCPNGYEQSGGWVTKLWGVTTQSTCFAVNDVTNTDSVINTTIAAGDHLVAAVYKDQATFTDYYGYFNKNLLRVKAGKEFTLTLKAFNVMAYPPLPAEAASGVKVGTWQDGTFKALKGKVTDSNGKVTLKFNKPGTYVVSARGSIDGVNYLLEEVKAPITAPVCVVKVWDFNPMSVTSTAKTVKSWKVAKKAVTVKPLVVKNAKGAKTFKVTKWINKAAKKYVKINKTTGKVTVKKGTPKGTYTFQVKVLAKGNDNYRAKSIVKYTKIVVR